ncbi:MAG: hypothetical protein RIR17_745 [Planctomycetota bacterium]|jgi:hypothetical protein
MRYEEPEVASKIVALQVIHLAMMGGVVMFSVLPLLLGGKGNQGTDLKLGAILCTAVFVGTSVAAILLPRLIVGQAVRKFSTAGNVTSANLFEIIQTSQVMRLALLEGSALMGALFHFLSRDPVFLIFPGIFLLVGCILFPTRARVFGKFQSMEEKIGQGSL